MLEDAHQSLAAGLHGGKGLGADLDAFPVPDHTAGVFPK